MQGIRNKRPTVGVLPGWAVYDRAILQNFLGPVLHGIRHAAQDRDCNLLLACGVWFPGGQIGVNHPAWSVPLPETDFVPVGPWNTDGLIVINPLIEEARIHYIQDLAKAGHPIVFVGTARQGSPTVAIDNSGGIRKAIAHLVAHNHRRIAFIAGDPKDTQGDSEERLQAYQAAIREYGLEADPNLVAYGFHVTEGGRLAMQQLLDAEVPFTAVLASSDECAIGAMQILREKGLQVPQDIAVVGFDDQPETMIQVPPLTTVHCPTFERGYRALDLLLEYIEGRKSDAEIIRVPTRLVVRQSCGCAPSHTSPILLETSPQSPQNVDLDTMTSQIAHTMAEAVLAVARGLTSDAIHILCHRLAEAFVASLEQTDPADFQLAVKEALWRATETGDDAHMWQVAISVLRSKVPMLLRTGHWMTTKEQTEDMLHWAREAISEAMHLKHRKHVFDQRWTSDRLAVLTGQLLTILDETQVSIPLNEHLPEIGIRHAGVAFYEPKDQDPVFHSVLYTARDQTAISFRFPSRQFPPEGLYSEHEPFNLAILPLVIQDQLAGFVAFDSGNLELCGAIIQQLAEALRSVRLYREATEGRRLAEEANRMKSRFLSTVSHELRTPINLIVGLSKMVLHEEANEDTPLPKVYRQDLERILISAQHLDALIQDVLDLARSEVGQLKLMFEPLNLADVIQMVAPIGEQMAHDKNLDWDAEIPDVLPWVWGDRTRLRQVVLNLVNNAIKFTTRGEVTLLVKAEENTVTITVRDTGLGIPVEEQGLIFDEFRQSERTAARGYGGLGLGLAICRRLIELHGGRIGVDSSGEEGAGSAFHFTLPVLEDTLGAQTPSQMQSRKVLLLSEQPGKGKQLREHLTRQGFDVEEVETAESTNWLSRLLTAPPGAVLLDDMLASKQGWEILKVLKGNPATQDVPVLFYALSQERSSGSILEMDYLTKPVGTVELAEALKRQGLGAGGDAEKTILIVDDEPGILDMHTRIVQAQSPAYRVLRAQNGREALELIRRERPDLVLLDLMMPEVDGFAVLDAMQQEEAVRSIPVIVLTGQVLTEDDMTKLKGGVSAVLRKGLFSVEETLAHVEQVLTRKQRLGSHMQHLVRKAMAYIHEHYAEPISREDIAGHIGVSSDHLTRCFRQETGLTPIAYLNRCRVNRAKTLLTAGDKSVTEIAHVVGFSDSNYFSRVFRREVGVSPTAYKRS